MYFSATHHNVYSNILCIESPLLLALKTREELTIASALYLCQCTKGFFLNPVKELVL